jgi:hypothetical protein
VKYKVRTSRGTVHDLAVYERGGTPSLEYQFEVDGELELRGSRNSHFDAYSAGLDLIRSLERRR